MHSKYFILIFSHFLRLLSHRCTHNMNMLRLTDLSRTAVREYSLSPPPYSERRTRMSRSRVCVRLEWADSQAPGSSVFRRSQWILRPSSTWYLALVVRGESDTPRPPTHRPRPPCFLGSPGSHPAKLERKNVILLFNY